MTQVTNRVSWLSMSDMPLDRKDGRQILLWEAGRAFVACWDPDESGWDTGFETDILGCPILVENPEHWSDLGHPDFPSQ